MNLFYLRYFVTLAHVKHYTRAAEQLCITQPSLSHAIAQLEKQMKEAAKMMEYEYAAALRDQIIELRGQGKK